MYIGISLSSGGARGLYELGAIHAADCNKLLQNVKYYAGCSIGSVICLLLCVGWTSIDLFTTLCTDDFFKEQTINMDVPTALNKWGVVDTKEYRQYLKRLVLQKYGGVPTFLELYKQTGKILTCCAYRLKSDDPCVYFNYKSHPDMNVIDAVMLSSNIPFLFQATKYNDEYYIDGSMFDANPIRYLERFICKEENNAHFLTDNNYKLLCISIHPRHRSFGKNEDDDNNETDADEKEEKNVTSLMEYIREILFIPMYCLQKVESTRTLHSISLVTCANGLTLVADNKTKVRWFCEGLQQGLEFLKTIDDPTDQ